MKLKIALLLTFCLVYPALFAQIESQNYQSGNKRNIIIDNNVALNIGIRQSNVLQTANTGHIYEIESYVSQGLRSQTLEGFKILRSAELTEQQTEKIIATLADTSTYFFTTFVKQCLFLPKFGIELANAKDTLNVIVSFKCDMIRFYNNGKFVTVNTNPASGQLLQLYQNSFKQPLTSDQLFELSGQPNSQPVYYTVEHGDAWFMIAQKVSNEYNIAISVEQLRKWNPNQGALRAGDKVIIGYKK